MRQMVGMRFAVFCLLFGLTQFAAGQPDPKITGGARNGRFWQSMSLLEKLTYVAGMVDGKSLAAFVLSSPATQGCSDAILHMTPAGFHVDDYVKVLDGFFSEPANVQVPIIYACHYSNKKLAGMPPDELASLEAALRKLSLELVEKK